MTHIHLRADLLTNAPLRFCAAALSILIPMGVVLYAVSGGLKATFTTSYLHTVVIFVVLCIFMFKTYCGGGELGSISKVCIDPEFNHAVCCAQSTAATLNLTRSAICQLCALTDMLKHR